MACPAQGENFLSWFVDEAPDGRFFFFCAARGGGCVLWRGAVPVAAIPVTALSPSFRRRPESILVFLLIWDVSREPAHVRVSSFDIPVDRSLLFACPKRSNQEKGHPRGRGHAGIHARVTTRAGSGVCGQCVHVLAANSPASCRRSLSRLFLHLLAATWRGPGKSRARQSLPQKLLLLILGPSVKRRRSAGQGRVHRTRGGPGRPAFGDRAGALPPNPGRPQRTGGSAAGA